MADVLILGGTAEARAAAAALVDAGLEVISSLAGRVSAPRLPVGDVRVGGFGGPDGLRQFLQDNAIQVALDATHPFAARITGNAVSASAEAEVPYLRLARPAWSAEPGDRWTRVPDIDAAAAAVADRGGRVLLTTGRQDVAAFAGVTGAWFLVRVVETPDSELPSRHEMLRSRGPYSLDGELSLIDRHGIDLVVTKNSGGALTSAKLAAAAKRGLEVIMVDRPAEPAGIDRAATVEDAVQRVRSLL
ncbi:cobalt-precorrin-6A reductase [Gordonia zhaorongruii]|uniref:cobalt-precorrin-6A reductase n=1 Tax=Gordonia zhaorongruii TaxID=2597659 RepID=UPI0010467206|nr:cobalt-precorrin-6A reductase [Gordonia zhaorongruii]